MAMPRFPGLLSLVFVLLALLGCNRTAEPTALEPQYSVASSAAASTDFVLAVHPLHNPQKLHEVFGPLIEYLNQSVPGAQFRLEASIDYATYDKRLNGRQYHFALPNPYQTVVAMRHGYRVIAKIGRDEDFRGIFIVRKDSGIRSVTDLKGKVVAYPAPTALAASMMPQYYLVTNGVDVMREVENRYVGSQESSIMNVYLGNVAAGATWPPPWRSFMKAHPQEASQLRVAWETPSLVNNSFMARDDIPEVIVNGVKRALVGLGSTDQGKLILARMETCCIEAANDRSYDVVQAFLREFSEKVQPLPQ